MTPLCVLWREIFEVENDWNKGMDAPNIVGEFSVFQDFFSLIITIRKIMSEFICFH